MLRRRSSLLTALVATTLGVTAVVSWATARLIVQQRAIDEQRALQQLETVAGGMVAALRGQLAEAGERLTAAVANPARTGPVVPDSVLITIGSDEVSVAGAGVPFVPLVPETESIAGRFNEAEALEFAADDLPGAARRYDALADDRDARIRAEALLRLGRVQRKRGDRAAALAAYKRLESLGQVRAGGLPAELAGLLGQRTAWHASGDAERESALTHRLAAGLDGGRWLLTRAVAEFYRDELGRPGTSPAWAIATAVDRVWNEAGGRLPARGQRVFVDAGRALLVMWRSGDRRVALMAADLDDFLQWRPAAGTRWHLADPEGRWIAGEQNALDTAVTRVVGDADYPWTLQVAGPAAPGARTGRNTLLGIAATMLVFLWGATYFMARAIRREAAVAQLQTDFVAAVSHEFRSPLTTIRQMAEMLEAGRVPGEERRHTYYRLLIGEAGRLQRLVETLLNFGRMEAGAARYQFADVDAASLVRAVVHDIEPLAREAGKRIAVSGPDEPVVVRADESALGVALRNLIDNAIKYSPAERDVRVEWRKEPNVAAIRVVDRGMGIPRAERQAVFRKFVRGRGAIDGNVKGTGVGLSMVQQIVAAHGGEVLLESEVGRGSTFTMILPASE